MLAVRPVIGSDGTRHRAVRPVRFWHRFDDPDDAFGATRLLVVACGTVLRADSGTDAVRDCPVCRERGVRVA